MNTPDWHVEIICPECESLDVSDHEEDGEYVEDDFGNTYMECDKCGHVDIMEAFEKVVEDE